MAESHERDEIWRLAKELREFEPLGDHIDAARLRDYVRGFLTDETVVRAIRQHLFRCEPCLKEELRLESQPGELWDAITLPLRALREIGSMWVGQPMALEASGPSLAETRVESTSEGRLNVEARVTLSGTLTAQVSVDDEPCTGWAVRLDRVGADQVHQEVAAITDERGEVSLGLARRPAKPGESFRLVATPPEAR